LDCSNGLGGVCKSRLDAEMFAAPRAEALHLRIIVSR